jgi:hypothetical protein
MEENMSAFRRLSIVLTALVVVATPSLAQEHFGDFLDQLKGAFVPEAKPRPLFRLDTDFRFKDPNGLLWSTPAGAEVDGASIPQFFWSFIGGPFEGPYISASVIHDHYCKTKERTAHDTHRNFYYGMRAANVEDWRAKLMHWAVETFGPSWKLDKRVVMQQQCLSSPGQASICTSVPKIEVRLITSPGVDLSDPTVLAAAISKTNAIARTLRTSNGNILDVTNSGNVAATPENISRSSVGYRLVFASQDFSSSVARLGLLSQTSGTEFGKVEPWSGNKIPKLSEALVLTQQNLAKIEQNAPYKLSPLSKDLIRDQIDLKDLKATSRVPADLGQY